MDGTKNSNQARVFGNSLIANKTCRAIEAKTRRVSGNNVSLRLFYRDEFGEYSLVSLEI
jgi:hypothetical protein